MEFGKTLNMSNDKKCTILILNTKVSDLQFA